MQIALLVLTSGQAHRELSADYVRAVYACFDFPLSPSAIAAYS